MRAFDASSMIYGWDNYPIGQFPNLWKWMASEVKGKNVGLCVVALEEVKHKTPECSAWLHDNDVEVLPAGNAELQEALRIKSLLGIVNDQYHPKGVGENDLIIISVCRLIGIGLVSDEERQVTLPINAARRKIPAVCSVDTVNVDCINFLEFLKQSGQVFG